MRFPCVFSRYKTTVPTGKIAIGGDTTPPTVTPPKGDNLLTFRFVSINGWPVHRIAVIYKSPSGATAVTGTMFLFEEETQTWNRVSPADVTITPGVVTFFDTVSVIEPTDPNKGAGSTKALLIIKDPNGVADGEHIFAMAGDLTTIGYP